MWLSALLLLLATGHRATSKNQTENTYFMGVCAEAAQEKEADDKVNRGNHSSHKRCFFRRKSGRAELQLIWRPPSIHTQVETLRLVRVRWTERKMNLHNFYFNTFLNMWRIHVGPSVILYPQQLEHLEGSFSLGLMWLKYSSCVRVCAACVTPTHHPSSVESTESDHAGSL